MVDETLDNIWFPIMLSIERSAPMFTAFAYGVFSGKAKTEMPASKMTARSRLLKSEVWNA